MVRPLRDIRLVEIVRTDAHGQQFAHQLEHHLRRVVHPLHQHRLVAHRDTGIREHLACPLRLGGAFPRVVEMRVDVQRVILPEHFAEFGSDPLRKHAGHFRAEAYDLHVREIPEPGDDPLEHEIGEHQGISAGEDHISHLGVRRDVVDPPLDILHVDLRRIPHLPLSGAKAAIHRALACGQEEDAVRIAMDNARHGTVRVFRKRIFREVVLFQLLPVRYALEPDRIAGIPYQAQIIRVDPDVEELVQPLREFLVEPEPFDEVFSAVHTLPQHSLPEFHSYLCSSPPVMSDICRRRPGHPPACNNPQFSPPPGSPAGDKSPSSVRTWEGTRFPR